MHDDRSAVQLASSHAGGKEKRMVRKRTPCMCTSNLKSSLYIRKDGPVSDRS